MSDAAITMLAFLWAAIHIGALAWCLGFVIGCLLDALEALWRE